jgi:hypothetical protein
VVVRVTVELEPLDQGKLGLRPVRLGHGDRPIQLNDGRACEPDELAVERGDLRPVARLLHVH